MCGRHRLSRRKQLVEEYFGADSEEYEWSPRYNIAPTQPVQVIRQNPNEPVREMSLLRWGLIPSWASDPSVGAGMINARSETASLKPAFREALQWRRCLIPADGFYEWKRNGKVTQPYCFEVNNGNLFAFAGLWDSWKDPNGKMVRAARSSPPLRTPSHPPSTTACRSFSIPIATTYGWILQCTMWMRFPHS
jgi:putative SOS response-associated peptidase YedK